MSASVTTSTAPTRVPPDGPVARTTRAILDVSGLPTVVFGSRNLIWWGTVGFMLIEGMTLAVCAASYLYVWRNFRAWPPYRTPYPSWQIPTLNMALMLLSCVPLHLSSRRARRLDLGGTRLWMVVGATMCVAATVLRGLGFASLNVRWDTNAYGSSVWLIVGFHTTLLVVDVVETVCLTVLMFVGPLKDRAFTDIEDNAGYWYFTVFSWLPLYALVFLFPRVM